MKSLSIYLSLLLIPIYGIAAPIQNNPGPVDFETDGLGAAWTWASFENVDNPALEFVSNPDNTGINGSTTVAKYTTRQAGMPWAGTNTPDGDTFTLDASNAIVKIMVYKNVISDVGIKFEQGAASTGEIKVANTLINQWEELTFDFTGKIGEPSSSDITGLVVFPDFSDARTSDNITYFDNITFSSNSDGGTGGGSGGGADGRIEAEDYSSESGTQLEGTADEGGGQDVGFIDAGDFLEYSISVAEAGSYYIDYRLASELGSSDGFTLTIGGTVVDTQTLAATGGWQSWITQSGSDFHLDAGDYTARFDFIGGAINFNWFELIASDGGSGGGSTPFETIEFESNSPVFTGFGGNDFVAIANPDSSGINTSTTVGSTTHGAETWAGIETLLDSPLDFSEKNAMRMKVWSPVAGTIKFKIEAQSDAGVNFEVDQQIEADDINQWVELVFDFSGATVDVHDKMALFFDFGVSSSNTFYFDDVEQVADSGSGGSGGGTGGGSDNPGPVDFESDGLGATWSWDSFENVDNPVLEFVSNPDATGLNDSTTVAKYTTRQAGMPWAGTNTPDGDTFTLDASNAIVKIMVYKNVISDVGIKFEQGAASTGEIKVANTKVNEWEELVFDFTGKIGEPSSSDITGLVVFPDFSDARTSDNITYFDNITFSSNSDGGSGGSGGGSAGGADGRIEAEDYSSESGTQLEGTADEGGGQNVGFIDAGDFLEYAITVAEAGSYYIDYRLASELGSSDGFTLTIGGTVVDTQTLAATGGWQSWTTQSGNDFDLDAGDYTARFDFIGGAINFNWFELIASDGGSGGSGGGSGGGTEGLGPIDFESDGMGASWSWDSFENVDNPALEFVSNPDDAGINSSSTVAQYTARQAGMPWAGTNTGGAPTFTLDASNAIVKIMVYKDVISDVGIKFEQGAASTGEFKVANTKINEWEELTFDFTAKIGEPSSSDITGLVVFPDFSDSRTGDSVTYFDNITFSDGTGGSGGGGSTPFETIDFESNSPEFTGFGGNDFAAIANPDSSGINTSPTVGSTMHGAETWAGIETLLVDSLDFTEKNAMKMKVWSPVAGVVKFKIEAQSDAGVNLEVDQAIAADQVNQWVELVFDFSGAAVDAYDKMALFFDFGVSSTNTFYFDDVEQVETEGDPDPFVFETIDFETVPPTFEGFEGNTFAVVSNPDATGENTSSMVAETTHGPATFAGLTLNLGGKVDFTNAQAIQLKVWSPKEGILVKLKLEDKLDSNINVEKNALTTSTNAWETLTFNFEGSPSNTYDRLILFLDFGSTDPTTFYFDDLELTDDFVTPDPIEFEAIDFEESVAPFLPFGGNSFVVSMNPDPSGINTSATVGETTHGLEDWGGLSSDFLGKLDFSSKSKIQIKVWSPKPGITVKLKLEAQADAATNVEKDLTTTMTNAWELLTFDFAGEPSDRYDRMVVFFDFGSSDENTFYFDDIVQTDGSVIPAPIDFEGDMSGIEVVDGATVTVVENPDRRALNLSETVALLENPGGVESKVFLDLGGKVDLTTQSTIQLRVWSSKAGATVRLVLDESPVPGSVDGDLISVLSTSTALRDYVMTKTNEWELVTFDFAGEATNTYDLATLTFDVGNVDANTYYFDSLRFVNEGEDNPHLVNVSTRGMVLSGEKVLIVGFVVDGESNKSMLIRGVGPTLSEFDVAGALADPYLQVFDADNNLVMEDDDWSDGDVDELTDAMRSVGAFELESGSKDAAVIGEFEPGVYTAHLSGVGETAGVGLIEAYELGEDENRLVNISTRGEVGTGDDILIGGFVVSSNSCRVLVRAAGVSLEEFGVVGVLSDPELNIFDSNGELVASNDDWMDSSDSEEIALSGTDVGAFDFGSDSKDSAVIVTLGAGSYTAQVSGINNTTGVALVEVYELQAASEEVASEEFVLISSSEDSDIEFSDTTIGDWSTGSQALGDVLYDGLLGWEITSGVTSPEAGNWGTVLAFQNGFVGDFSSFNRIELKVATTGGYSGGYKIALSGNGVNKEIGIPVNDTVSGWQSVSLSAADIPLNLSSIDWISVYGIGGQIGVSKIYITDFVMIKDEAILVDEDTAPDFVFISSDPSVESDLVVDDDNLSDVGNAIIGEWSTGTVISSTNYSGLEAMQLMAGGSWGAVLALQGDISDGSTIDNYDVDFSDYTNLTFKVASEGAFERYAVSIVSNINGLEASQEVGFSLTDQSAWNMIDIDLESYGVDLSNVSQLAVFGVYEGGSVAQKLYITDLIMYDSGRVKAVKPSSDETFVFITSTGEEVDIVVDDDDFANDGNLTIGEWSTGTQLTDEVVYNGLSSFELTRGGESWGAVLALMGDVYGDVQEYDLDISEYSTVNFKIAAVGGFSEYVVDFLVDGSEYKWPLTVNGSWTDVSIDVEDIPLDTSKITQIAIFGIGGNSGDKIYITDFNIAK